MTSALSLYLLAAGRAEAFGGGDGSATSWPARPPGDVLWIHLSAGQPAEAAATLASRVADERIRTSFVVTTEGPTADASGVDLIWVERPPDFPRVVDAFLAHWRPAVAIWIGGPIRPVLAARAARAGVSMILANATSAEASRHRGVPARDLLGLFQLVVASSAADGEAMERATAPAPAALGRLQRSSPPLDHDEREYRRLSQALDARPVWFAAGVTRPDVDALRRAQAIGQGASHRLLLIVEPADAEANAACVLAFGARRSTTGAPPAGAAALVADLPGETGLWYRLASVSLIGGSLLGPQAMADPFAPAALGSAILHGPLEAPFEAHFKALRAANATRPVADPARLGHVVSEMLSPDLAATLAHRAWSVVSEGAEATDLVADTAIRLLDGPG